MIEQKTEVEKPVKKSLSESLKKGKELNAAIKDEAVSESKKQAEQQLDDSKSEVKSELKSKAHANNVQIDNTEPKEPVEVDKLKLELEKTEKRYKDTQKSWSELSHKLRKYEQNIKRYLANGTLSEEEANTLLSEVAHEAHESNEHKSPIERMLSAANSGVTRMRELMAEGLLDEDPLLDKKIRAFDAFLEEASREEVEDALKQLTPLHDEPIRLAKKMLGLGEEYYQEVYAEIDEAGNLRKFKNKYQHLVEELQDKIDKAEKKILEYKKKYEDYVLPNTMKLPAGSGRSAKVERDKSLQGILNRSRAAIRN